MAADMETNGTKTQGTNGQDGGQDEKDSKAAMRFLGKQPYGMPQDLVIPKIMDLDNTDERLWVPQAPSVDFRPLLLSTSHGYFVNILRVKKSGILSRHQHTGPVVAVTLRGRWHYLEHDWWAEEGGLSFEPPGETHTLEVPDDCRDMYTLFHVTGAYVYVDPHGQPEKIEDVFSKLKMARDHYERVGLGRDFVDQFIR